MTKEAIIIPTRPKTLYSPGMKAGDYIFLSGQVGDKDENGREVKGIEAQARRCLENMKQVLEAAGSSLSDVVKVNIFLAKADDFGKMNEIYQCYFTKDLPARSTIVPSFVRPEVLIEIECTAYCP